MLFFLTDVVVKENVILFNFNLVLIILILNDFVLFYVISFYSFFIPCNVYDFITQNVMSVYF